MTEHDFDVWFAALDLGRLEDVRDAVEAYATENAQTESGVDWACARATVLLYLDDPSMDQAFR